GNAPHSSLRSEGGGTSGFQHEEALERVDPGAGSSPIVVAVPLEFGSHGFGHAPAMDVAESGENPPGHPDAEGVDELLPEQALGDGVEDERALAGKVDQPPAGIQFEQFLQVKGFDAHTAPLSKKSTVACPKIRA